MKLLNSQPTVVTGSIRNLRMENGEPVCDLRSDMFVSFETAQFATWINIAALPQASEYDDDSTRAVAVIPQGSTRDVRASPIIIGILGWHGRADSIESYQIPTLTSKGENVTLRVTDSAANITNTEGGREVTPVLRGDLVRDKMDEMMSLINDLQTALSEVSTAAQAPSLKLSELEFIRAGQGGSWAGTDDSFESDSLEIT